MPLWKLQTVGGERLDFTYPNVGRGKQVRMHGEAVYCFRRFRDLIGELAQSAWVRFVGGLIKNRPMLGESADLRGFLFGADRALLTPFRQFLWDLQDGRCFYCDSRLRGEVAVDHFIPWSRYALDLGHNLVLADCRCNGDKADRLAALDGRSRAAEWMDRFDRRRRSWTAPPLLPVTTAKAERPQPPVFDRGQEDVIVPDDRRRVAGWQWRLPEPVEVGAEANGWPAFLTDARAVGSAKL